MNRVTAATVARLHREAEKHEALAALLKELGHPRASEEVWNAACALCRASCALNDSLGMAMAAIATARRTA